MDHSWCLYCMSHMENGVCPNHCPSVPANEPHMLQPGTILNGRYLVGRSLGHGGFGITYIGRDTVLDIPVAVKEFFPTGIATRDISQTSEIHVTGTQNRESLQREVEKFLNEARTLAQFLDEPGIVTVRDFFSANGTAYIVTEYIKGEPCGHTRPGWDGFPWRNCWCSWPRCASPSQKCTRPASSIGTSAQTTS